MFYKIGQSNQDQKYYISPNTLQIQSKFLIQCDSKAEADVVVAQLTATVMQAETPYSQPNKFVRIGYFGETEVYRAI